MDDRGVFVFAEGGFQFFRTVAEAAGYVEAVDVEDGVYEDFMSLEGERLVPRALDSTVIRLDPSGEIDPDRLVGLLRREHARRYFFSDPADPVAVANEMLTFQWESRLAQTARLARSTTAWHRSRPHRPSLRPAVAARAPPPVSKPRC